MRKKGCGKVLGNDDDIYILLAACGLTDNRFADNHCMYRFALIPTQPYSSSIYKEYRRIRSPLSCTYMCCLPWFPSRAPRRLDCTLDSSTGAHFFSRPLLIPPTTTYLLLSGHLRPNRLLPQVCMPTLPFVSSSYLWPSLHSILRFFSHHPCCYWLLLASCGRSPSLCACPFFI